MAKLQVKTDVSGLVCKIEVAVGQGVREGDIVVLIESMKMEIPVTAESAGKVMSILIAEGDVVVEGQPVVVLES